MNIIPTRLNMAASRYYWLAIILGSAFLLVVALFYQYVFDELPCVICIQIRLWLSVIFIIAVAGYFGRASKMVNLLAQVLLVLSAVGLVERCYQLLGIERGFVFGDCSYDLGFPAWFGVDQWLPWLYGVETSCGYTPEILFKITMAEVLILLSVGFLLFSVGVLLTTTFQKQRTPPAI